MKFSIDKELLFEALTRLYPIVGKKNPMQILAYVLCSGENGSLSLSTTDLEVGMRISLPATIDEPGCATIPAKHFLDIARELPNQLVTISKKDNDWVETVCAKSRFNMASREVKEFPLLPEFDDKFFIKANAKALREMIDYTSFAIAVDTTRFNLNGVYFEPLPNNLMRMTATDGHRMSFIDKEVFLEPPQFKNGLIIPEKGLTEIRNLLNKVGDVLEMAIDRGYIYFRSGEVHLFVRLIEGEYPDYRLVIPDSIQQTARIAREPFYSALKRVSLLAHEKSHGIKLFFTSELLTISTNNPDMGEAYDEVPISFNGDNFEIGFNSKYILDCLPIIESEELSFSFKDKLSSGIIQGLNQKNHSYLVMPMRV